MACIYNENPKKSRDLFSHYNDSNREPTALDETCQVSPLQGGKESNTFILPANHANRKAKTTKQKRLKGGSGSQEETAQNGSNREALRVLQIFAVMKHGKA